jgi:hypothetical protein
VKAFYRSIHVSFQTCVWVGRMAWRFYLAAKSIPSWKTLPPTTGSLERKNAASGNLDGCFSPIQAVCPSWSRDSGPNLGRFGKSLCLEDCPVAGPALLLILALVGLYRFAPDMQERKWKWLLPGSIVAALR